MKKRLQHILGFRWLLISMVVVGCSSTRLQAAIYNFQSSLDPVQAGVPGSGGGFATLTLDDASGLVILTSGSFSNLSSTTTAAHIHGLAAPGVGAGVLIGLTIPLGATSGTISGSGTLNAAGIAGMLNGLTYVNIHTSTFGGGEIRGQNLLVPEPGSFALIGLGGFLAAIFMRNHSSISTQQNNKFKTQPKHANEKQWHFNQRLGDSLRACCLHIARKCVSVFLFRNPRRP